MTDGSLRSTEDYERVRAERDLFVRLLELSRRDDFDSLLAEALGLVVDVTGARQGYLELRDPDSDEVLSIAHGFTDSQLDVVRARISKGILARAIATGETMLSHSALLDERFRDLASVQASQIEAVLCAPIGRDDAIGAVYLQGRDRETRFREEDRESVELFADHLVPCVDRILLKRRLEMAEDATAPLRGRAALASVVGRSRALAAALEEALLAAPLDVSVLLSGASGTGKSQLARVIHDNSARKVGPLVELSCANIPETLFESELFGALRGSHSGAEATTTGRVGAADGGTLFLDEIGELPLALQPKLLQLLQSGTYFRVGDSKPQRANVRIIAATNRDLEEEVKLGRFREDLFYRLHVLPIRMPSLAERREDLPDLAHALVSRACATHGVPLLTISTGALRQLMNREWPGNVRQLANLLEAGVVRAHGRGNREIQSADLFRDESAQEGSADAGDAGIGTFQEETRHFQRSLVARALEANDWNVAETARRLDMARSHLYNLIRDFKLERASR